METVKLWTINTRSIIEEDYEAKLGCFVNALERHAPHIVAMQEVNQSTDKDISCELPLFMPCTVRSVKADNHALRVVNMLRARGLCYYWTWVPVKLGYGKYDEGLAMLSRYPISAAESIYISNSQDYNNWKTRRLLGIVTEKGRFYNVHMGWWNDAEEPFLRQWERVRSHIRGKAWLMGDFNSPDDIKNEGYSTVRKSGWNDAYELAQRREGRFSVVKKIDGWECDEKMRLDYIWCNYDARVLSTEVIFDGKRESVISDHFGVSAEIDMY